MTIDGHAVSEIKIMSKSLWRYRQGFPMRIQDLQEESDVINICRGRRTMDAKSKRNRATKESNMAKAKKRYIVRTYSAGVFFGEIVKRKGEEVEMRNARRIWYWD